MSTTIKHERSLFQKSVAVALLLLVASISAFATPTALTTQVLYQNNAVITAGQLALTFTACDNVNGNSFTSTGREILIMQNTDSSSHTVTVTPVTDPYGGTNTSLTNYSLAATGSAGSTSAVQMKYQPGWASAGVISMTCTSALVKFAVLQFN
jgi:hypothetical protein